MSVKKIKNIEGFPKITKLYISKPIIIFYLLLYLILFCIMLRGLLIVGVDGFGMFILMVLFYFIQKQFRRLLLNKPQIVLSYEGIETLEHPHFKWTEIKELIVCTRISNKTAKFYLQYNTPTQWVSICLEEIHVDIDDLKEALNRYRGNTKHS